MKKYILAVIMLCLMAIAPAYLAAEEYVINGYGLGEYAVKEDIELQAKKMIESWGTKKPAKIIIHGFADKTGKTAENDSIARDRAQDMKVFLEEKKIDAKITARSLGDSEDARKVMVNVEFTATVPAPIVKTVQPKPVPESFLKDALGLVGQSIALAVLIVILFFAWFFCNKRKKQEEKKVEVEQIVNPFPDTTTSMVPIEITVEGRSYRHFPEVTSDGRYKTFHEFEPGKFMFVPDEKSWKRSVRSTLNKNKGLIEALVSRKALQPIS